MKYLIVDPPSGWLYNFPRSVATVNDDTSFEVTASPLFSAIVKVAMEKSGYKEKDIEMGLRHLRVWFENKPSKDEQHNFTGLPHID